MPSKISSIKTAVQRALTRTAGERRHSQERAEPRRGGAADSSIAQGPLEQRGSEVQEAVQPRAVGGMPVPTGAATVGPELDHETIAEIREAVEVISYELAVWEENGQPPKLTAQQVRDRVMRDANLVIRLIRAAALDDSKPSEPGGGDAHHALTLERLQEFDSAAKLHELIARLSSSCVWACDNLTERPSKITGISAMMAEINADLVVCLNELQMPDQLKPSLRSVVLAGHGRLAHQASDELHKVATRLQNALPAGSVSGPRSEVPGERKLASEVDPLDCMRAARFARVGWASIVRAGLRQAEDAKAYGPKWPEDYRNQVPLTVDARKLTPAEVVRLGTAAERPEYSWLPGLQIAATTAVDAASVAELRGSEFAGAAPKALVDLVSGYITN